MSEPGDLTSDFAEVGNLKDLRAVVYGDLLRGTFRGLSRDDWRRLLDVADSVHLEAGRTVLRQGLAGQGIFIVAEGMVQVARAGMDERSTDLAELGVGEVFGEMSYLEDREASASVITAAPTELVRIDAAKVTALLDADAALAARFYKALALALSDRLRRTNTLV